MARARPPAAALWERTTADNVKRVTLLIALCFGWADSAAALDHVVLRRDGQQIHVDGRLLVTAQDGGLLVLAREGVLWAIPPEQQVKHTRDEAPFKPLSRGEMSKVLLAELPRGFDVHQTANYLIFYNTSRAYAQWCGTLFERLYRAFTNFWRHKGFDLSAPEFPLVAIVFADQGSYIRFSKAELGDAAPSIIGYFSLRTNRMIMYDLTGMEALSRFGSRRATTAQINQILSRPEAFRTVATIVHEATHQIAFNCGLHTRYSDCPLWFSEGIALYFETPDLQSTKGWSRIGVVNQQRLLQFHDYLKRRPPDSLKTLIADDTRFRDPKRSLDAYAEAWSLTYYLIQQSPKPYVAYLKMLSGKKPLLEDGPQTRLEEFEGIFGDLKQLDGEFLRYMRGVR
jgi:hypothetical protein